MKPVGPSQEPPEAKVLGSGPTWRETHHGREEGRGRVSCPH